MTDTPTMNLLWSYVYARNYSMDQFLGDLPVQRLRFFADSGAHSARTLGIDLSVDDYAAWVKQWHQWFTVYANLDVIWSPQATRTNQHRLEEHHGLSPTPVFHTGEDFSVLQRYLDEGYTYIALGKLLGNSVKHLRPWIAKCFRMAGDQAVFHGFGLTVWQLLREFPFYSVDSSSWGSGVRYGVLKLFHRGRWVNIRLRDRDQLQRNRHIIDAYGIPYSALSAKGYDRAKVAGACAVANYRAAEWLRAKHGTIELPEGRGYPRSPTVDKITPAVEDPGPHRYLADGSATSHQWHAGGLHLYLADASRKWTNAAAYATSNERTAT